MRELFILQTSFNRDISDWDVSSMNTMYGMFYFVSYFNHNVSNWGVFSMQYMFYTIQACNQGVSDCYVSMVDGASFFDQDLSNWHVCRVI